MNLSAAILAISSSIVLVYSYVGFEAGKQGNKIILDQQNKVEQINSYDY
jgi:hypothetical protein